MQPRNKARAIHFKRTKGQALVEYLYVSLAMVPLFLLLPMIGKYQDVSHATQMASRYVALDSMANHTGTMAGDKDAGVIANEIRQRFFSGSRVLIRARDGQTVALASNAAWRTPFDQPLIAQPEDIRVTFGLNHRPLPSQGFDAATDRDIFNQSGTTGAALANRMNLPGSGLFQANVSVRLANLPTDLEMIKPFDTLNLVLKRSTVVLHETWAADGPERVETRTAELVPVGQALKNLEPAIDLLVNHFEDMDINEIGRIPPPRFNRLATWRDMVPSDRMQ